MRTIPLALPIALLLLAGCPDPEGQYEEFKERFCTLYPEDCVEKTVTSACESGVPKAGEVDGSYLWTVSTNIDPKKPVLHDAQVTTKDGQQGLELSIVVQGLDKLDRKTKVGMPQSMGPFKLLADGSFSNPITLVVVAAANPLAASLPEVTVTATVKGYACPEFSCGVLVEGKVKEIEGLEVKGDHTFEAAPDGVYPDPPRINCDKDPADPPPMMN